MDLDVRVTNRYLPPAPAAGGVRLFEPEGSAGGCASGDCLPSLKPEGQAVRPPAERWRAAVEAVKAVSPRHGKSLAFGRLVALAEGEVALYFPKESAFHRATVTSLAKSTIEKALSDHFGRPTRVVERQDESAPPSLAELEARGRADREKGIEAKVREHPAVQSALRLLGGQIEHIQVLDEERPSEPELPEDR